MNTTKKELFHKLVRLQRLMDRDRAQRFRGRRFDPSRGQGRILAILKMQPEISVRDLSYLLDIRQQSLSELLGKLEKAGYITREASPEDHRSALIRLTEEGRATTDFNEERNFFGCLSEEEQAQFGEILSKLIASLEEKVGPEKEEEEHWQESARHRMGPEGFEAFMAMRRDLRGDPEDHPRHRLPRPEEEGERPCRHHRHFRPEEEDE